MIQYNHKRKNTNEFSPVDPKGGETIALEVPATWFLETLQPGDFFEKKVGKARCSDDDNYNKKTGRELATSRMKTVRLTCGHNKLYGEDRIVILIDPTGHQYVLKTSGKHYAPHFIDYE
jgi:hypothetical protein